MFWLGGVPALLALYIRTRVPESEAWKQHRAPSTGAVLRVNNTYGIFRAVESGLGIASLPDYLARESTKLEIVLPDLNVRTTDVYFTYPEELRHSKRIAVFRDFLMRKVAETRF